MTHMKHVSNEILLPKKTKKTKKVMLKIHTQN